MAEMSHPGLLIGSDHAYLVVNHDEHHQCLSHLVFILLTHQLVCDDGRGNYRREIPSLQKYFLT